MPRKHRIKLKLYSDKQFAKIVKCPICMVDIRFGELCFYVDESNIAITYNSIGYCKECYTEKFIKNKWIAI